MKYFGTDGVRGIFGRDITPELCRAVARMIIKQNAAKVVVGFDTRAGGVFIADIITNELRDGGVVVECFGVVTTAQLSFLTVRGKADYGIMITASHNDYRHNGIKVFNSRGGKQIFTDDELDGQIVKRETSGGEAWCDYLCEKFAELRDWTDAPHIIVDAASGAGAGNARTVFERLGLSFEIINDAPNGFNINADCGAIYPRVLFRAVRQHRGAAIGFAFDGDADRCVTVAKRGVIHGDKLIALLGGNEERIVATKIFNPGVESAITAEVIKADVGDHFVLDAMAENNIDFGGETSGHIIDRRLWHSGDGLLTALMLLARIKQNPRLLSSRIRVMPFLNRNITITPADKAKFENADFGANVIVRASGTEDLLRITVFGPTKFHCRTRMKRAIMFAKNLIKH